MDNNVHSWQGWLLAKPLVRVNLILGTRDCASNYVVMMPASNKSNQIGTHPEMIMHSLLIREISWVFCFKHFHFLFFVSRGFGGNIQIVFKHFRTSRLYVKQTWGQRLFWVQLTFTMNINDCPLLCKCTVHFLSCWNTVVDSNITSGPRLVFMSVWIPCSRCKSNLKAKWGVRAGQALAPDFLYWPLSGELFLLQGHPGLGLLITFPLAMGRNPPHD